MKRIINIIIVIVLIAITAGLGWITYGYRDWDVKNWGETLKQFDVKTAVAVDGRGNELTENVVYSMPDELVFLSSNEGSDGVSVTLNATVLPETAKDKSVDWSIEWRSDNMGFAVGKIVTDYVTITPIEDGSTTATLTCLQPFEGFIDVKVKTRATAFTAKCKVSFEGKPEELVVSPSQNVENWQQTRYDMYKGNIAAGVTYTFNLSLDNTWSNVGGKFYDFDYSLQIDGDIECGYYTFNAMQPESGVWRDLTYYSTDRYNGYNIGDGDKLVAKPAVYSKSLSGGILTFTLDQDFIAKLLMSVESIEFDPDTSNFEYFMQAHQLILPTFTFTVWQKDNPTISKTIKLLYDPDVTTNVVISPDSVLY